MLSRSGYLTFNLCLFEAASSLEYRRYYSTPYQDTPATVHLYVGSSAELITQASGLNMGVVSGLFNPLKSLDEPINSAATESVSSPQLLSQALMGEEETTSLPVAQV
ncbi:hypothetical protein J6590_042117 [Homalodisca vitripennis]|nr:hypothetical protein J6590_042117 [Homalodisca vitripennis]